VCGRPVNSVLLCLCNPHVSQLTITSSQLLFETSVNCPVMSYMRAARRAASAGPSYPSRRRDRLAGFGRSATRRRAATAAREARSCGIRSCQGSRTRNDLAAARRSSSGTGRTGTWRRRTGTWNDAPKTTGTGCLASLVLILE
jgi:hypothetical protein